MKNNLIFIGMPAVGKSTVGVVVAKRLGMRTAVAEEATVESMTEKILEIL